MSARIVDKEGKRNQILKAALRTFARNGFVRSTMQEIAVEAGIGKGTIYEYFQSKDQMIQETWSTFMQQMDLNMENVTHGADSAPDKIRGMVSVTLDIIRNTPPEQLQIIFSLWGEAMRDTATDNPMFVEMNRFYRVYREMVSLVLRQGIASGEFRPDMEPETTASAFIGMLDGLVVQWILDPDAMNYNLMARHIPDLVLSGIRTAPATPDFRKTIPHDRRKP